MSGSASLGRDAPTFTPALDFFRAKLDVPTSAWDSLYRDQHAVAFTVAGAMRAALLGDLRDAVRRAIEEGRTLAEFRQDFDRIVETHGWAHKGKPGWRARVIYETNLRTAYAAGKWQQIQETRESHPYLRYSAVMDSRTRTLHRGWHGTILPVGHAWWRTHYPPNGWGCRCTVIPLSDRDLQRRGWQVSDPAPSGAGQPRAVRGSEGNRIESIPPGIDPGWDYNVGMANARWQAARQANDQLARLPPDIAAAVYQAMLRPAAAMAVQREAVAEEFRDWAGRIAASGRSDQGYRVVGALPPAVITALDKAQAPPATAALTLTGTNLVHLMRDAKQKAGIALSEEQLLTMPRWIGSPDRAYLQRQAVTDTSPRRVILTYRLPGTSGGAPANVVVRLAYTVAVRQPGETRSRPQLQDTIRTVTVDEQSHLRDTKHYELIFTALAAAVDEAEPPSGDAP